MAAFIVKYKLKGRPNRNRPQETFKRSRIILGSRPLAEIYTADRMTTLEAVAFEFEDGSLKLDVLDQLAGVFLDGQPVGGTARIENGAQVQVGQTLVDVELDTESGVCTLTASELYLTSMVEGIVKKAKPETPFSLDPDGPQEQRWGASDLLGRLNWLAVALGLLPLLAFVFVHNTEAMTRGELSNPHQASHGEDSPQDCAACHSPFSSDYAPKCAECHEGLDGLESHPYEDAGDTSCAVCHTDHRGADGNMFPESELDDETGWQTFCLGCHDVLDPADSTRPRKVKDAPGVPTDRPLMIDGFAHSDHRIQSESRVSSLPIPVPADAGEVPIDCAECHTAAADGTLASPIETAEFALVSYEQCLGCHEDWKVDVHGRDDDGSACASCHDKAATPSDIVKDIRTIDLPGSGSVYALKPRQHDFQGDECLECHVLEKQNVGDRTSIAEMVFRHDHHLPTTAVAEGTGLVFSEQCMPCHTSVAQSETLGGTPLADLSTCTECHTGGEPVAVAKAGESRTVVDMFHRIHTVDPATLTEGAGASLAQRETLSQGCMSCHVPVKGETRMTFKDGTQDCSACHTRHASVGRGLCAVCHVDRAYEGNQKNGRLQYVYNERGIFDLAEAVTKTVPAQKEFDHGSPGHVDHPCAECHDTGALDSTGRVTEVAWPANDEDSCVECHALTRYHR